MINNSLCCLLWRQFPADVATLRLDLDDCVEGEWLCRGRRIRWLLRVYSWYRQYSRNWAISYRWKPV